MHIRRVIATLATLGLGLALLPAAGAGAAPDKPAGRTGPDTARAALSKARAALDESAHASPRRPRRHHGAARPRRTPRPARGIGARGRRPAAGPPRRRTAHLWRPHLRALDQGRLGRRGPDRHQPRQRHPGLRRPRAQHAWSTSTAPTCTRGYRAPKPDRGRGGNNKRDIYLSNLGDQFLYGYCTTRPEEDRPAVGRLELLRARQQLHRGDLRRPHADREHAGDRGPRVLPRGAVRLRRRRGHLADGGHGDLGRGRALRRA